MRNERRLPSAALLCGTVAVAATITLAGAASARTAYRDFGVVPIG